jgi:hypothetical protein
MPLSAGVVGPNAQLLKKERDPLLRREHCLAVSI